MHTSKLDLRKYGILTAPREVKVVTEVPVSKMFCDECDAEDKENSSGNFAADVYRDYLRRRKIVLNGVIDESSVEKVTLQLMRFNDEDDEKESVIRGYDRLDNPVTLLINSPGGYASHGLSIVSQMTQSNTPILTYGFGDCSSMASLILLCGHARFISPYSRVMLHSLASGFGGKLYDKIDDVEESKRVQTILDQITTSRTLITQKQLDAVHTKRQDWYLDAGQALALSIVDEVMAPGLRLTPPKKRKK